MDASVFRSYFTKSEIKNLLDENKINNIVMNAYGNYFEYKRSVPIIAFGTVSAGMLDGIIINGNHRIAEILSSNKISIEIYLIDCINHVPSEFFLNEDYRKMVHILNLLNKLN